MIKKKQQEWKEVYRYKVEQIRFDIKLNVERKEEEFQIIEILVLGLDRSFVYY